MNGGRGKHHAGSDGSDDDIYVEGEKKEDLNKAHILVIDPSSSCKNYNFHVSLVLYNSRNSIIITQ